MDLLQPGHLGRVNPEERAPDTSLRCQMLSVNPKMLPRLDELKEDLIARRERAISEGWRGEVEGLELTLTFLRSKRDQTRRAASMGTVSLGMPVVPRR